MIRRIGLASRATNLFKNIWLYRMASAWVPQACKRGSKKSVISTGDRNAEAVATK
jgi:hypothetical protein